MAPKAGFPVRGLGKLKSGWTDFQGREKEVIINIHFRGGFRKPRGKKFRGFLNLGSRRAALELLFGWNPGAKRRKRLGMDKGGFGRPRLEAV